ncbi:Flp pilus assembly complex ATPase component TadA [Enterococcus hirae]|nr:Flp pilus assembly complex ATPase component TadA [Enterococcus hirae]
MLKSKVNFFKEDISSNVEEENKSEMMTEEQEKVLIQEVSDYLNQFYPCLKLESLISKEAKDQLSQVVLERLGDEAKRNPALADRIIHESIGLGVIEDILQDQTITDISYNGIDLILENNEKKWKYPQKVTGEYINNLIGKLANADKKEFNDKSPILDMQLNNLRINAIHHTLAEKNTTMAIRVSREQRVLTKKEFLQLAPLETYYLLKSCVCSHCNMVLAGETGAGKTVLQQLLMSFIPFYERIVLVEDTPETHPNDLFPEKDIISWHGRSENKHGSVSELIKASLRNNPKWVSVAEIRRAQEAYEWMQALLSDHCGITTIHAIEAEAIPDRILNMVLEENHVQEERYLDLIKKYVHIGVQLKVRNVNGKKIRYIQKIVVFDEELPYVIFTQRCLSDGTKAYKFEPLPEKLCERLIEFDQEKIILELEEKMKK